MKKLICSALAALALFASFALSCVAAAAPGDDALLIATEPASAPAAAAMTADGFNTAVSTVWIIIICSVVGGAVIACGIILARRNMKKS